MTEEQAWILLALGALSAVVSAGIAVWSIRNARYAAIWRATLDFIHDYNNDPRVDRGLAVVRNTESNIPLEKGAKRDDFLFLINRLEILAIGLDRRVYDKRIIADYFGRDLKEIYADAAPLIRHVRQTENDPEAFAKFEEIARGGGATAPRLLERLFPIRVNNDYRGHPAALWLFALVAAVTLGRSVVHIFAADGGAQSVATIPLDSFTSGGSAVVVGIFAFWGLSQLLLALFYFVVLWRYRAIVPLMYLFLIVEYMSRFAIGQWKPLSTVETAPGEIANYIFVALGVILFALSLRIHGRNH